MSTPIDLIFVRHGQSELNKAHDMSRAGNPSGFSKAFRKQHTANVRLSELGRVQAKLAGAWLQKEFFRFDAYITSPYARAMETAGLLGLMEAWWKKSIHFAERDWGSFEQTSRKGIQLLDQKNWELREQHPIFWRPINGERFVELCNRMDFGLKQISEKGNPKQVIIVCHGETMHGAELFLGKASLEEFELQQVTCEKAKKIFNCEIVHYTRRHPNLGTITNTFSFVRRIRPTENPVLVGPWKEIQEEDFSSEEILDEVSKHPHYFEEG